MSEVSSALALRAAIHQRLAADAALAALLGGAKIYDEPPRGAVPPYVLLADCATRDASGDEAPVQVHELTIEVWSRQGGLSEALKAADRATRLLDGAALAPSGVRLVDLAWISTGAGRLIGEDMRRAELTFRAVTEPA